MTKSWKGILPSLSLERLGLSMPLRRCVVWIARHFLGLGIESNFLIGLRFVFPVRRNELAISHLGRYASMKLLF